MRHRSIIKQNQFSHLDLVGVTPSTSKSHQTVRPPVSMRKDQPSLAQKNAAKKISAPEVFDDSDEESLEEIEMLNYYIVEPETEESLTWADPLKDFFLGDVTTSSAFRQFAIGGIVGWLSGYLAKMFGAMAAMSVGGALFLIQMAQYHGFISVHWSKVSHSLTKQDAKVKCFIMKHRQSVISKVRTFYEENFFMASGFITGLGITATALGLVRDVISLYV